MHPALRDMARMAPSHPRAMAPNAAVATAMALPAGDPTALAPPPPPPPLPVVDLLRMGRKILLSKGCVVTPREVYMYTTQSQRYPQLIEVIKEVMALLANEGFGAFSSGLCWGGEPRQKIGLTKYPTGQVAPEKLAKYGVSAEEYDKMYNYVKMPRKRDGPKLYDSLQ